MAFNRAFSSCDNILRHCVLNAPRLGTGIQTLLVVEVRSRKSVLWSVWKPWRGSQPMPINFLKRQRRDTRKDKLNRRLGSLFRTIRKMC